MTRRLIEVSHAIEPGMKTYPGLPEPRAEVLFDYADSAARYRGRSEFFIASLHLCGNTGTYVDSPMHRFRGAADLAALPLDRLADLEITVIDAARCEGAIQADLLRGRDLGGKAVLFHTGFSRHWRTERYFKANPFVTRETCELLVDAGARFAGIDSLNIDDIDDFDRPAHTVLLGAGIPVCEHMTNLAELPPAGGRLHAVPIAWRGGATFPVRAYVVL